MKYKFRVTLQKIKPDDGFIVKEQPEFIEADDLVQLVLQFSMLITRISRDLYEEELRDFRTQQVKDEIKSKSH